MLWQDEDESPQTLETSDWVDLAFTFQCAILPLDHLVPLSAAIQRALPWLAEEPQAGLHLIHIPEEGNGWMRGSEPDGTFYPSKRTRLTLRLPGNRVDMARDALIGQDLDIAGQALRPLRATVKPLSPESVLYARHVIADPDQDEEAFLRWALEAFGAMNVACRKLLPGKTARFQGPDGEIFTRALMIADLEPEPSLRLQTLGLGSGRTWGCGLFIPHKGIAAVKKAN